MAPLKWKVWDILGKRIRKWGDIMDLPAWEIFPGTPEQRTYNVYAYTGLSDINSKEIYEGDIVIIHQWKDFYGEVMWNEGMGCYMIQTIDLLGGTNQLIGLTKFCIPQLGLTVIENREVIMCRLNPDKYFGYYLGYTGLNNEVIAAYEKLVGEGEKNVVGEL